jgi:hypothetical protein
MHHLIGRGRHTGKIEIILQLAANLNKGQAVAAGVSTKAGGIFHIAFSRKQVRRQDAGHEVSNAVRVSALCSYHHWLLCCPQQAIALGAWCGMV